MHAVGNLCNIFFIQKLTKKLYLCLLCLECLKVETEGEHLGYQLKLGQFKLWQDSIVPNNGCMTKVKW